ncbi:MAG: nucleotidyltransferase domain-containing protein [Phycisphaerales bacterium]|nr:nucleotidyltransferase domain-containing protein [Phycisphaerales bacterium]
MVANISIPEARIAEFCRKWRIAEFSLFGSVLRDDFRPDSDVDVLVAFEPDATPQLEAWLDMLDELKAIFGREVDLVEKRLLQNPFRRHHILNNRQVVYAA